MEKTAIAMSALFFGLWLLLPAYLVVTSGYVPRALGWLLAVGGVAHILDLAVRSSPGAPVPRRRSAWPS